MMIPTDALILLDTNILVHLLRGDVVGQRLVVDYDLFNRPNRPLISFVTVGEMYALARKRGWETRRQQLLEALLKEVVVVNIHQPGIVIFTYCCTSEG